MPIFRLGTINHAKGYVLNKLFEQGRIGGRHVPVGLIQGGYPPKWRHLIGSAIDSLRHEGLILIRKKRTEGSYGLHASIVPSRLQDCRALINAFRSGEGLGRVGRDMKTILPIRSD